MIVMICCTGSQIIPCSAFGDAIRPKGVASGYQKTIGGMAMPVTPVQTGTLKGIIQTTEGKNLEYGDIYFFNDSRGAAPAPEKFWRVPDEMSSIANGVFTAVLPPGSYYISAMQRNNNQMNMGPPAEGDYYFVGAKLYTVDPSSVTDIGTIKAATPFSRSILNNAKSISAVKGTVLNADNKPVSHVMVFAHKIAGMNDKPLFASDPTGVDGKFTLRVAGDATYYLRVRDIYGGGTPATGSFVAVYGNDDPRPVTVKKEEIITGLIINGGLFIRPKPGDNRKLPYLNNLHLPPGKSR